MKIALVGATGVVGEQILEQFIKRSFPVGELRLFASAESEGEFVDFGGESQLVRVLSAESFEEIDLAIFATPAEVSHLWCPVAAAAGVLCIDLSAARRLDDSCDLLVEGINIEAAKGRMISTPASLTVQLALLLAPLRQLAELRSLLVTTVSPSSGLGRKGIAELQNQTGELLNGRPVTSQGFPSQMAFNCLPSADTDQEEDLAAELRKVLTLADLDVRINRLQLPVFYGEGAFVRIEFSSALSVESIRSALKKADGLSLQEQAEFPALSEAIGEEELLVRLCLPSANPATTLDLWYAADNVGRFAAGNVVRLAEKLVARAGRGLDSL